MLKINIMKQIRILFIEGGPVFMYSILLLLIIIFILFILGLNTKINRQKTIDLISSFALIAIVLGLLGQAIHICNILNLAQMAGNISFGLMIISSKITFFTSIFGAITFIIARLGIIILVWIKKEDK